MKRLAHALRTAARVLEAVANALEPEQPPAAQPEPLPPAPVHELGLWWWLARGRPVDDDQHAAPALETDPNLRAANQLGARMYLARALRRFSPRERNAKA